MNQEYEFEVREYRMEPGSHFAPDTVRVSLLQVRPYLTRERSEILLYFRADDPDLLPFVQRMHTRERMGVTFHAILPAPPGPPSALELDEVW